MITTSWIILPYLGCLDLTAQALEDCLNQSIPVQVLLINQGGDSLDLTYRDDPRVFHWTHTPPFPSLAAGWNRALDFVWEVGGRYAWVVNNDVRLHPQTYERLLQVLHGTDAWFVSGCGVTAEQYWHFCRQVLDDPSLWSSFLRGRGGPDFSCYVITRECHARYQFDEGFVPGYCEDLDFHRRLMLDGHREKIFGVNLPFHHIGSATINQTPEMAERYARMIDQGSRQHYRAKWGGECNAERYRIPFDPTSEQDGVTTPELQHDQAR